MTRGERRALLAFAIVLALVCSALFARAVLAQHAAGYARAQERAALLSMRTSPSSDLADRTMLGWSGATGQMRFWRALQQFRLVIGRAKNSTQYTLAPPLSLIFQLGETETALQKTAVEDRSRDRRSRLEDMLGLTYFYDAALHAGQFPVEPQLLSHSAAAFRQAVLLDGTNAPAKTNLELALEAQRKAHPAKTPHTAAIPGQSRAQNALQATVGHTAENGAVGRHIAGGY